MKRPVRALGVTLLEVVIGAALLSAIAAMIYGFMAGATSNFSRDSARQTLQDNARRLLDEIANDLRDANRDAVIIPAAPGNTSIKFQKSVGFDATTKASIWSAQIEYKYEPSTVDANGNNIVDEGRIVRVGPDSSGTVYTIRLCDYVKQGGFTVVRTGDRVTISITQFTLDDKRKPLELTLQTSLALRNHP